MKIGAIILAAGPSSRLGRSKQLLDVRGEILLVRTIKATLEANITQVAVVLGAAANEHRKWIERLPVDIVLHGEWKRGMGSSLRAGLTHLTGKHKDLDAVIILVCDQPLLSPEHIINLVATFRETGKPIVASRYAGMPGVPVLFGKNHFNTLLKIPDSEGAKKLIMRHPDETAEVDFPGGEVDLDTPEDYAAFLKT